MKYRSNISHHPEVIGGDTYFFSNLFYSLFTIIHGAACGWVVLPLNVVFPLTEVSFGTKRLAYLSILSIFANFSF